MSDEVQSLPDLLRQFRGRLTYVQMGRKFSVTDDDWRGYEEGSSLPDAATFDKIIAVRGSATEKDQYLALYKQAEEEGQAPSNLNPRFSILRRIARAHNWINGNDWGEAAEKMNAQTKFDVTESMLTRYVNGKYPEGSRINRKIDQRDFERVVMQYYQVPDLTEEHALAYEAARDALIAEMSDLAVKMRKIVHHVELRDAWAEQIGVTSRTISGFATESRGSKIGPTKYRQLRALYEDAVKQNPKLLDENIIVTVGPVADPSGTKLDEIAGDVQSYLGVHSHGISFLRAVRQLDGAERDALREDLRKKPGIPELLKLVRGLEALVISEEDDWEVYTGVNGSGCDL